MSLVAGLSPRRPIFAPGSVHVVFVADKVALVQVLYGFFFFCRYHSAVGLKARMSPGGMNNWPVGGGSSETLSRAIYMNNKNTRYSLYRSLGVPHSRSQRDGKEKHFRSIGNRTRFTLPVPSHYNLLSCLEWVDWSWWIENDVSELRPLRAFCSSPGDCDVDHGMMVSAGANS
jgi:hypothetical protein